MSKFQVLTKLWQKTLFFANLKDTVDPADKFHFLKSGCPSHLLHLIIEVNMQNMFDIFVWQKFFFFIKAKWQSPVKKVSKLYLF